GGVMIMGGSETRRRRARRARSPASPDPFNRLSPVEALGDRLPPHLRRPPPWATTAVGALGALMLAVGALASAVPSTLQGAHPVRSHEHAPRSYEAQIAPDAVYPSGTLRLPDPVFVRLVTALDLTIGYDAGQVLAAGGQGLAGSYAVYADLQAGSGWRRRF